MPLVSIVMPCYNAGLFLEISVRSVMAQTFKDWELIIVNDGSADNSAAIALMLSKEDDRIQVVQKENGGYVSARLFGYKFISADSRYVIFYDADDKIHPEMLGTLVTEMEKYPQVGAVYCNHVIMDENDRIHATGVQMPRLVPTRWWVDVLDEEMVATPFISIFCWTKMIEPMTLLRRAAYEQTNGWDLDFGKGQGNIGDGVFLFSEIALNWQVHFINRPLYYYRRHSTQSSAVDDNRMKMQAEKVIQKWKQKMKHQNSFNEKVNLGILFFKYRVAAYKRVNALKHQLRYHPAKAAISIVAILRDYLRSLPLFFSYKKLLN